AEVFFAPAWMCVVLLAVAAVPRRWSTPAAGVLALAAAASLAVTLPQVTMRGNTVARVFAEDVLATVGQNALLVTSADYETFPVRYLQIVEGARPDVLLLDEQRDVEKGLAALGMQGLGADDPLSTLATQQARPVYFTRRLAVNGATLRPVGVLLRAWRGDRGAAEARRLDAEAWGRYRPLPQGPWLTADWSTASIAARYEEGRARSALARGDLLAARACVARAAAFLASDATHQNSLGALLAGGGDFAGAQPYYQRAIALRPKYPEAHYNAITAYINGGDVPSAQAAYARSQQAGVSLGEAGQRLEAFFMQAGGR
ncbi:MAG: tetratricopeptide repeat protein, partial [Armatimonadetes bacterium]|nr:tetratricopeptide repeat protein [Armatimonadota bacterium]